MKQNNSLRIGAAAVLATVTVCGGLALAPAAFADSTVASATAPSTAHSATHSAVVRPATADACQTWLEFSGYSVTVARAIACGIGAAGLPNTQTALTVCIGTLVGTKVDPGTASIACSLATVPG